MEKKLWVDPSVKESGDGTAERPFKTIKEAVDSIDHVTEDTSISVAPAKEE